MSFSFQFEFDLGTLLKGPTVWSFRLKSITEFFSHKTGIKVWSLLPMQVDRISNTMRSDLANVCSLLMWKLKFSDSPSNISRTQNDFFKDYFDKLLLKRKKFQLCYTTPFYIKRWNLFS